jgi:phosphohistidine swiveling domain-containing protein
VHALISRVNLLLLISIISPLSQSCSLLSHSVVVARELGLPTIVGVSGKIMKRLKMIYGDEG